MYLPVGVILNVDILIRRVNENPRLQLTHDAEEFIRTGGFLLNYPFRDIPLYFLTQQQLKLDNGYTFEELFERMESFGLKTVPDETALLLAMYLRNYPDRAIWVISKIPDSSNQPCCFVLHKDVRGDLHISVEFSTDYLQGPEDVLIVVTD